MARKPVLPQPDPDQASNARVLAQREKRIQARVAAETPPDLGLEMEQPVSQATDPAEFLADEFDRKAFGEPRMMQKTVYGPDPLLRSCPDLYAKLEKYGLEDYAEMAAETIRQKQDQAFPDPVLKAGIRGAIGRFGVEPVARAFRDRILKIPVRTVEIPASDEYDEFLGDPLAEAMAKYLTPGFAARFLSDHCIAVLGMRGYRIVKNEFGDPVKVGTLTMAEIPQRIADRRRMGAAEESERQVREIEEEYGERLERAAEGATGVRVLSDKDVMHANATEEERYLGQNRPGGVTIERERERGQ
jgi:hypothetical protein